MKIFAKLKSFLFGTRNNDPPEPDTQSTPQYVSEDVVELLFSPSNRYRAIITTDREGHFRVHRDYWCIEDFEYIGEGYWCQNDTTATITDTLELARKLANEALDLTGDRVYPVRQITEQPAHGDAEESA